MAKITSLITPFFLGNTTQYPFLCIDDTPLNIWVSQVVDVEVIDLCTAQGSLNTEADNNLSWELIRKKGLSTVPLLVCPDDLDFYCTVVAVEQSFVRGKFVWSCIGYGDYCPEKQNFIITNGINIDIRFKEQEFLSALDVLEKMVDSF